MLLFYPLLCGKASIERMEPMEITPYTPEDGRTEQGSERMKRVTPAEAVRIGRQLTVSALRDARNLYDGCLLHHPIRDICDCFWLIAMIFNAGRIEGIRVEREARRSKETRIAKGE